MQNYKPLTLGGTRSSQEAQHIFKMPLSRGDSLLVTGTRQSRVTPPPHWRAAHSVAPRPHGGRRHLAWTPIELHLVGDSWHQEATCSWDAVFGRFECRTQHDHLNKKYEKQVGFRSSCDWFTGPSWECMQCKSVLSRFSVLTRSSKSTLW